MGGAKFYRGCCQAILIPQESVEISLDALCTIEIEKEARDEAEKKAKAEKAEKKQPPTKKPAQNKRK